MGMRPGKAKGPYVGPANGGGTPANPTAIPTWFPCFDFAYTDFTGFAALSGDIEIYSLPAYCTIEGAAIRTTTAFVGAGITNLQLSAGIVGDLARYISIYDALAAVSNTNVQTANQLQLPNVGAATSIRLAALAVGANLSALTAGAGCLWLKVAKLTP